MINQRLLLFGSPIVRCFGWATSRTLRHVNLPLVTARDALVRQFRLPEIDFDPEYMLAEPPREVIREREAKKRAQFEAALLLDDM